MMNKLIFLCGFFIALAYISHAQQDNRILLESGEIDYYEYSARMDAYYKSHPTGKGSGYKQYMRWKIYYEPRLYPSGELFNVQARNLITRTKFLESTPSVFQARLHSSWTDVSATTFDQGFGESPGNGRINVLAFHPSNPDVLFAGAPVGGLWKSIDGGGTWTCLTDAFASIGVSGIVVDPTNPNNMFLLTGDGDAGESYSIGVLRSSDAGTTWSETGLTYSALEKIRGFKLAMDPNNPNTLYACMSDGLWKTVDGGDNFTQSIQNNWVLDLEFRPGSSDTIHAVGWRKYMRTYDGTNWDIDSVPSLPDTAFSRIAVAVSPADPDYVYLLYGGGITGFKGLYRSTDNGATFHIRSNTPNILTSSVDGADSSHQASYDLTLAIDPANVSNVFAGGINNWKSTDGGFTWNIISHWVNTSNSYGYVHADQHALEFNDGEIYAGSDGGIYRSGDNGITWNNISQGINILQVYDFDFFGNKIITGTQDNGTNLWVEGNTTATQILGGDGFECIFHPSNTMIVYACTQNNRMKSSNGGISFSTITPFGDEGHWDASWIMHPTDPDTLYSGFHTLYRTMNGGFSWFDMDPGFLNDSIATIRALAQGVDNSDIIYASNRTQLKVITNAHALTNLAWSDVSFGLPFVSAQLGGIAVDNTDASRVWVTFMGYSSVNKVFFSDNYGVTWTNVSGSLPNVPVNCIAFQPGSVDALYLGTDIGIFYRDNTIGDWQYFSNGLPNTVVSDLKIDGSYIYAATYGRGIWKSTLASCAGDLILTHANDPSSPQSTGTQYYEANNSIQSSRIIKGEFTSDVIYNAGMEVILTPGFHIKEKGQLEVKLGGCN